MPEAPPGITLGVRHLGWGGQILFENFRFRLDAGRWTCLLGPSGVGKTTLLRLLAGHESGALVATDDARPLEGRVALMAQQDLLLPWLSARENVLLGPRLRRVGRGFGGVRNRDDNGVVIDRHCFLGGELLT